MNENLSGCIPTLRVNDATKSCAFYCEVLGFKKNWEHRFGPGYPLFVSVSRGPATMFLTEHPECSSGALVYFYVKDVDSLASEFKDKGALFELGPVNQPWRVREVHLCDPDGNKLRFGQALDQES
jgi:catechol 2,3-dioxygenase-like lactoylglutathione lyase family enzyme